MAGGSQFPERKADENAPGAAPQDRRLDLIGARPGPLLNLDRTGRAVQRPLALAAVELADGYLNQWRAPMLAGGIDHQWRQLEREGMLERLQLAGQGRAPLDRGPKFAGEARLYKWLEAACIKQAEDPDPLTGERIEQAVGGILAIAAADGYLGLTYPAELADRRWRERPRGHELFAAGHLLQAGMTMDSALGDGRLLRVAEAMADLIGEKARAGELADYRDHPCCEMALIELWRSTGRRRHLDTAEYLLAMHAEAAERPVRGHAVCLTYFAAALADAYLETGRESYLEWSRRWWEDVQARNSYITGAVGGRPSTESFGRPFELPHEGAYAESCAAIGMVMWAQRMLFATGRAEYADQLEASLYNAVLAGVGIDAQSYFYDCPQARFEPESDPPWQEPEGERIGGARERSGWFFERVACCPPNLARILAQLPGYLYGFDGRDLWLNLYAPSQIDLEAGGGPRLRARVVTGYPYAGNIEITIETAPPDSGLRMRLPGWCRRADLLRNGESVTPAIEAGYVYVPGPLEPGDRFVLCLDMPVELAGAGPRLVEARGQAAIVRGPLVYCLESADQADVDLRELQLRPDAARTAQLETGPLGSQAIRITGARVDSPEALYFRGDPPPAAGQTRDLLAVPFAIWGNRGSGQMAVWTALGRDRAD